MADFGESGQESGNCDHWVPLVHFGDTQRSQLPLRFPHHG